MQTVIDAALLHHRAGRLDEAERLYQAVLAQEPLHADALHLAGVVADTRGQTGRAIALIGQAIGQRETPAFRFSLGSAFLHALRHRDALEQFHQVLALGLDNAEVHRSVAEACNALGLWPEAEAASRQALANAPDHADAWFNLAATLYHQGRFEEALAAGDRSLAVAPEGRGALTYRGHALRGLGRLAESAEVLRRALALRPDDFGARNNLALTLEAMGAADAAIAELDEALRLAPADAQCRYNRGNMLLREGRFAEGWADYESRIVLETADETYTRFAQAPRWRGEALLGRSILLAPEQGAGDVIMFARYAAAVAARGGRVVMAVRPEQRRLLQGLAGVDAWADVEGPVPHTELCCPLLSLPLALGTTLGTIPAGVPYLRADPALAAGWQGRLAAGPGGLRVGLVWAGNPHHANDRLRSLPFAALAPLLGVAGVRWYSLQRGERAGEATACPDIEPLEPALADWAETAAVADRLDLVITVDTAVAHLAGAMGRRVWVMLPHVADWRWLTGRETSPWYPTMRLFRQDAGRAWAPVVARVAAELSLLARHRAGEARAPSRLHG